MRRERLQASLVQFGVQLYRVALLRYPSTFRTRHGDDLVADVRRLLEEATREHGVRGWAFATLRVVADLLRPLPGPIIDGTQPDTSKKAWARAGPRGYVGHGIASAVRSLRRSWGFSLLVIGVLGVGVGLNVGILTVVDAYLLRTLPYPDAERLVEVRPATSAVSWTDAGTVFERVVAWELEAFTLVGDPSAEVVLGAWVSPDFFDVYGVELALGRAFRAEDAQLAGASVAVISHELWERRFGADPGVLGRTIIARSGGGIEVDGGFTVIGVLPRAFWYLNGYTDVLAPLRGPSPVRTGRLRSDVPLARAAELINERAATLGDAPGESGIQVRSLQAAYTESVRPRLVALQTAALLALLVAVANVTLLLVARVARRRHEMGVRRALGADTRQLGAQLFSEGFILSVGASLVGIALAWWTVGMFGPLIEARLGRAVPGGMSALLLDGSTLAAAAGGCLFIGLAFGVLSLRAVAHAALPSLLGSGGRGVSGAAGTKKAGGVLVAAEIALSLTLLTVGALVVRSALHLETVRLGFPPERLMAYQVGFTAARASEHSERITFFEQLEQRAASLPTVESVGLARSAPFVGALTGRTVESEAGGPAGVLQETVPQIATSGYFRALALELRRGRMFTPEDGPGSTPVAIVSESLAAHLWDGEEPLGKRIRFPSWTMPAMDEEAGPWLTVVGVVPDVVDQLEQIRPTVYVPFRQAPSAWMNLVVRIRPGALPLTEELGQVLGELDGDTPFYSIDDIGQRVSEARAPARFLAGLLGGFAVLSVLLATVGLYGLASFAAGRRKHELAVRMTLGAERTSLEGVFVREAASWVLAGIVVGGLGGRILAFMLRGQLYGVESDAVLTPLAVASLLGGTALIAVWVPVHLAARSALSDLLRGE